MSKGLKRDKAAARATTHDPSHQCLHNDPINMRDGSILCGHCGKLLQLPPPRTMIPE